MFWKKRPTVESPVVVAKVRDTEPPTVPGAPGIRMDADYESLTEEEKILVKLAVPRARAAQMRHQPEVFCEATAMHLRGDWFPSKVAGVSKRNNDGTSRQKIIQELSCLDELELEPEPENPYDECAIGVWTQLGEQIGYLNSRLAGETTRAMNRGTRFLCFVLDITGQFEKTQGVNIAMIRWSWPLPDLPTEGD